MAQAGEHSDDSEQKQGWWRGCVKPENVISELTLIVLTVTMVYVIKYARISSRQNDNLTRSVNEEVEVNRPVVLTNGIFPVAQDPKTKKWNQADQPTDAVVVNFINFGRTLADKVVAVGMLAIVAPEEDAPHDQRCSPDGQPSQGVRASPLAPTGAIVPGAGRELWPLRNSDNLAQLARGDILYAAGCIYYKALDGLQYYTDVCAVWHDGSFQLCSNPNRNLIR